MGNQNETAGVDAWKPLAGLEYLIHVNEAAGMRDQIGQAPVAESDPLQRPVNKASQQGQAPCR